MAAQLFLDYGLITLFPFFLLVLNSIAEIFKSSAPTSTSQFLTAAFNPMNHLQLSAKSTASVYLAVLGSFLLAIWIIYVCYAVPASSFEPLWTNESNVKITKSHFWAVAPTEGEGVALEAFSMPVEALLRTQALGDISEFHRRPSPSPTAIRHQQQK